MNAVPSAAMTSAVFIGSSKNLYLKDYQSAFIFLDNLNSVHLSVLFKYLIYK